MRGKRSDIAPAASSSFFSYSGSFRSLSTIENDPCPAYLYGEALKLEQSKRICVPVIAGPITVALFGKALMKHEE